MKSQYSAKKSNWIRKEQMQGKHNATNSCIKAYVCVSCALLSVTDTNDNNKKKMQNLKASVSSFK